MSERDPLLIPVLVNRLDAIVREMSNILLRSARSAVINMGRDFSCSIVTADNRLLASAEGLPVHVFGSHLQTRSMVDLHPDLRPGDAFLHNDVYMGNTHPADQTVLVPVFVHGEHCFTACAKAHQADIGNSQPTTYMPMARDIYEEGALVFPCVKVQSGYADVEDVIRMCRSRIRVPDQWYGDYLAALGAARVAEQRLQELVAKYGADVINWFVEEWFDYSERRAVQAIRAMPAGRVTGDGRHDPLPGLPEGIPLRVTIEVDPEAAMVRIDLTDNVDCLPVGLNLSLACATNNSMQGVFNVLGPEVPHNAGSFRRMEVMLRDGSAVGGPIFPHSCSVATTNLGDRLVNATQAAFAQFGDGWGLAEGGLAMGIGYAVISGRDWRRAEAPFVNQLIAANNGGPASPWCDGWITWGLPVGAGLTYRDSVEVDEQKYPVLIRSLELLPDSGGPGRFRGGPTGRLVYGPRGRPMTVMFPTDGHERAPGGALGGLPGRSAGAWLEEETGSLTPLPAFYSGVIEPGQWLVGVDCGGGGYGLPTERAPDLVLADVLEGLVSPEAALEVYGVVLTDGADGALAVDEAATAAWRGWPRSSASLTLWNVPLQADERTLPG